MIEDEQDELDGDVRTAAYSCLACIFAALLLLLALIIWGARHA